MDCRLAARLKGLVAEVAKEYQQELAAAGTLLELEDLSIQIGDEVGRQLTQMELVRRGASPAEEEACPDCGRVCSLEEVEPAVLQGVRGEIAYSQPKYYCRRCRRSFFPDGGATGDRGAEHGDAQGAAKGGLGGEQ